MPFGSTIAPTSRTEAFSDGVFAIAITILVLGIRTPDERSISDADGLLPALLQEWPAYLSYLATFLMIGTLWLSHHATFRRLARIDTVIQWWNLVLLLFVTFIFFPNALVAEHLTDGLFSTSAKVAVASYGLVGVAVNIPWIGMWVHLGRHPELMALGQGSEDARNEVVRPIIGASAYSIAALVALLIPVAALALYIALAVFFMASVGGIDPRRATRGHRAPPSQENAATQLENTAE